MIILNDFTTSVERALTEIDPKWKSYNGTIICGNHSTKTDKEIDNYIGYIKKAKEEGTPFLGICAGHQFAAMEHAGTRDVLNELPELKVGMHDGETYWNYFEVKQEILDNWDKPYNFITCQYHPEYQNSKDNPHPLLVKFIQLCKI